MKAKLEAESEQLVHRGFVVESENDEKKLIFEKVWLDQGRVVVFARYPNGNVELTIAPTREA